MIDVLKNRESAVEKARKEIVQMASAHPVPESFE